MILPLQCGSVRCLAEIFISCFRFKFIRYRCSEKMSCFPQIAMLQHTPLSDYFVLCHLVDSVNAIVRMDALAQLRKLVRWCGTSLIFASSHTSHVWMTWMRKLSWMRRPWISGMITLRLLFITFWKAVYFLLAELHELQSVNLDIVSLNFGPLWDN